MSNKPMTHGTCPGQCGQKRALRKDLTMRDHPAPAPYPGARRTEQCDGRFKKPLELQPLHGEVMRSLVTDAVDSILGRGENTMTASAVIERVIRALNPRVRQLEAEHQGLVETALAAQELLFNDGALTQSQRDWLSENIYQTAEDLKARYPHLVARS
jgi:hypothetical protein